MITDINRIDRNIPVPLYYQLKTLILEEIQNGNYPYGSKMPTEMEISHALELSRTTVRQAITELVSEGWLYRQKSKGTFVSRPKISQDFIQKLESFNDQMNRLGKVPRTEVMEMTVIDNDEDTRTHLNLDPEDKVIKLYRRRFADEEPLVLITTYLPYKVCKGILGVDLNVRPLYEVLEQDEDTKISYVKRRIEAVEATKEDGENLNMKKGKPILYFKSIGYNIKDEPIEYSLARYCGDRSAFEITVFPG